MSHSIRQIRDFMLLLLLGGVILWLTLTRQLVTYLTPTMQPYTALAGFVLLVMAAFALRGLFKKTDQGCSHDHSCCNHDLHAHEDHDHENHHHGDEEHHHEHCDHGHHHEEHDHSHHAHGYEHDSHDENHEEKESSSHHDHGHGSDGIFGLTIKTLLILLPVGFFLFGGTNHYTMATVKNRGVVNDINNLPSAKRAAAPTQVTSIQQIATAATVTSTNDSSPAGPMPLQVIDLLYAIQMPSYRSEFEGKQVEMVGQFVPLTSGNPKGDRFQAIRLFLTCCAADAKPVGVTVQYDKSLKVAEMGWVKITGTPTFPLEGGRRTAVLVASKVEECATPDDPFVH